jgi:hypothetical protein
VVLRGCSSHLLTKRLHQRFLRSRLRIEVIVDLPSDAPLCLLQRYKRNHWTEWPTTPAKGHRGAPHRPDPAAEQGLGSDLGGVDPGAESSTYGIKAISIVGLQSSSDRTSFGWTSAHQNGFTRSGRSAVRPAGDPDILGCTCRRQLPDDRTTPFLCGFNSILPPAQVTLSWWPPLERTRSRRPFQRTFTAHDRVAAKSEDRQRNAKQQYLPSLPVKPSQGKPC